MLIHTNRLLQLPAYREALSILDDLEKNRAFCKHHLSHFLDVARIARILVLERGLAFDLDDIYVAALLHDLGRIAQYRDGIPHHIAGEKIATDFLEDIAFPANKRGLLLKAISAHGAETENSPDSFAAILQEADHLSRPCLMCPASEACYWPETEKNTVLTY